MRVVVTGATGNIGTALLSRLADEPAVEAVVGVARRRPGWRPDKVQWIQADVARDDLAPLFRGASAVVHLAWLIQPSHRPLVTWGANVHGTENVLQAVHAAGVPGFVYSSSVGAYSPGPKDRPVDESWPTDGWPTAAYCREKAYVERLLDRFERERPGHRVVRIRPAFVFQRHSASQQRRLFAGPAVPGRLATPRAIPVVPDFPGLRLQVVHAADVAEAFRLALVRQVSGAFNVAADPPVDAHVLAEHLGAHVVPVPRQLVRAGLATAWGLHVTPSSPYLFDAAVRLPVMDTGRARRELGWTPAHTALDAVDEFLAGLRENAGFDTPPLRSDAGGPLRYKEILTGVGVHP
ncbi:MAG TPA: NAD-dependent epimerase/dehydratase family protein [Streptosporangiales bacterium]